MPSERAVGATTTKLYVATVSGLPSFMVFPENPTGNLNLFISPSCNDCELLMLNVLAAYKNNDPYFSKIRTTFSLMPANTEDVDLISGFLCIDNNRRAKAIKDYYTLINQKIGRGVITSQIARDTYTSIMNAYGISGVKQNDCEANKANRAIVGNVYKIGDKYRTQDVVPLVLYNDRNLNVIRFADLQRAMR